MFARRLYLTFLHLDRVRVSGSGSIQTRNLRRLEDQLRLPAGVYPVYIIAWGKRETMEHQGKFDGILCEDDADREVIQITQNICQRESETV
jgi:hypothetical protein